MIPVSKLPSEAVALCGVGPSLRHVTLSPAVIEMVPGVNLKSLITTVPDAATVTASLRLRGWRSGAGSAAATAGTGGCAAGAGAPGGAGAGTVATGSAGGASSSAGRASGADAASPGSARTASTT